MDEYAFVLREGGRLYTITDVKELYDWEVKYLNLHPLFRAVPEEEIVLFFSFFNFIYLFIFNIIFNFIFFYKINYFDKKEIGCGGAINPRKFGRR